MSAIVGFDIEETRSQVVSHEYAPTEQSSLGGVCHEGPHFEASSNIFTISGTSRQSDHAPLVEHLVSTGLSSCGCYGRTERRFCLYPDSSIALTTEK